jgi:hypothetical protein
MAANTPLVVDRVGPNRPARFGASGTTRVMPPGPGEPFPIEPPPPPPADPPGAAGPSLR